MPNRGSAEPGAEFFGWVYSECGGPFIWCVPCSCRKGMSLGSVGVRIADVRKLPAAEDVYGHCIS